MHLKTNSQAKYVYNRSDKWQKKTEGTVTECEMKDKVETYTA